MSKKINIQEMGDFGLGILSNWSVADCKLREFADTYKSEKKVLEDKISEVKKSRKDALASGKTVEELDLDPTFSFASLEDSLDDLTEKYKNNCSPFKKAQKEVYDFLGDYFYYGYVLAIQKEEWNAIGTLKITDKESVKIDSNNNYRACIKQFLVKLGLNCDNETATNKVCQAIWVLSGGTVKDRKNGLLKPRNRSAQYEMVMRAVLTHFCKDRGALVIAEDGTVSKRFNQ